uniref:Uncharacterized protein n=1 Tax=Gongylonema pulchrum TaxID=637853 RepID=A0A183DFT2_9BILA
LHDETQNVRGETSKMNWWRNPIRIFDSKGTTKIYSTTSAPHSTRTTVILNRSPSQKYEPLVEVVDLVQESSAEQGTDDGPALKHDNSEEQLNRR